jgi:transcriptional regulator with XRE-family HTH domain
VPADPVREHVQALGAAGIGWKRAAELAGISKGTMRKLLQGGPGNRPPCQRIRPDTAAAILAVQPSAANLGARAVVDATGTRRRVQALVAVGWSQAHIAAQVGLTPSGMSRLLLHQDQVTAATARAVRAVYDELWDQAPPEGTHWEKASAARARNHALASGWAPPAAWDDDRIDDPQAPEPAGWQRTSDVPRGAELAEEAAELFRQGYGRELAAERLRVSRNTLDKAIERQRAAETRDHEAQRARFAAAAAQEAAKDRQAQAG